MATIDNPATTAALRSQFFDKVVKGLVEKSYKFKQALTVESTSAWKNFFYREDDADLTDGTINTVEGIPRGADFPVGKVKWERVEAVIKKYGMEDNIPWEDIISDDIPVLRRTAVKLAERVAKSVDDRILIDLGGTNKIGVAEVTTLNYSSFSLGIKTGATDQGRGGAWNETSAAILDNLYEAKQLIGEANLPTSRLQLWVTERDHRSIMKFLTDKGAQFPSLSVTTAQNGQLSNLAGFDIIVSNSMETSNAMIVVPQRVGSWKTLKPLSTVMIDDPMKHTTVRVSELGVVEVHQPKGIVLIMNTVQTVG